MGVSGLYFRIRLEFFLFRKTQTSKCIRNCNSMKMSTATRSDENSESILTCDNVAEITKQLDLIWRKNVEIRYGACVKKQNEVNIPLKGFCI